MGSEGWMVVVKGRRERPVPQLESRAGGWSNAPLTKVVQRKGAGRPYVASAQIRTTSRGRTIDVTIESYKL